MKSLLVALTLIASVTLTRANITYASLTETGDYGATNMTCSYSWSASSPTDLGLVGTQWNAATANLYGYVNTDSPTDPTLNLGESINNDTGVAWTDYHVTISMAQSFTFTNVSVSNPGWTLSYSQPTLVSGSYVGTINYNAGTPVSAVPQGELTFGLSISFTGPTSFTETATPSFVPEPSVVGMGAVGGLLMLIARARRNR